MTGVFTVSAFRNLGVVCDVGSLAAREGQIVERYFILLKEKL